MSSLSKMQERAREEVENLIQWETPEHEKEVKSWLDSLIARTREQVLDEVEAGMEKTRLLEVGVSPESLHMKLHYNQVLDKLLDHLASLRKQGEGKEL